MPPLEIAPSDLAHCRALLRAGSKSFSTAGLLLPRPVRDRATVLYAFCRVADDAIDDDPRASAATVDALRERLYRAYAGRPLAHPVDRALAGLFVDTHIPLSIPDLLLEGMEWDVLGRRYETLDELRGYAHRVAGTVGEMMTLVMGRGGDRVLARAADLGVAMQLTNIARDVGEDARRGRVYLPLAWLREANVEPDAWLARPAHAPEIGAVVARLLGEADALYARADEGVTMLPRPCRAAIRAARLVYSDIGREVARARFDSVSRRAVVPTWRKVWLVLRAVGSA